MPQASITTSIPYSDVLFQDIAYIDSDFKVAHGYVGVRGGRIAYVGEQAPGPEHAAVFQSTYSGSGRLLIPGLHNAHAHAPMTLLRGIAENLPLDAWLNEKVFPFEAHVDEQRALPATRLAIAEMLAFGVVSFADMYYFSDARAQAVMESGIKINMSEGIIVFDEALSYDDLPAKAKNEYLIGAYQGANDGQIVVDLCIHTEYTTTPKVVQAVGELAVQHGLRTQIHLSETRKEHEECKARRGGLTPAAYFESLGFFRQPCIAAHCVWAEPEDWEIFKRNKVTAVCNPASNMKLGSGFAPVGEMLAAGVNVALGTDGVASNNSHNLLKDMYLFALLYKGATGDPTVVTPAQALYAATRAGALALGREDTGLIAEGMRADLAVLDIDKPWMQPTHDLLTNLVYSAQGSDVVLTMADGRILYRDGQHLTIDVARAAAETAAAAQEIHAEL